MFSFSTILTFLAPEEPFIWTQSKYQWEIHDPKSAILIAWESIRKLGDPMSTLEASLSQEHGLNLGELSRQKNCKIL